jgi:hypothetical protein
MAKLHPDNVLETHRRSVLRNKGGLYTDADMKRMVKRGEALEAAARNAPMISERQHTRDRMKRMGLGKVGDPGGLTDNKGEPKD